MIHITHSTLSHIEGLSALDGHLDRTQMQSKIVAGEVIHAEQGNAIIGILRYSLFWDQIPFMNLIRISEQHQRQGVGKSLVATWEQSMAKLGHRYVLTSTQSDEQAQHFYRHLGYTDIGGFVIPSEPLEIILHKAIA
ncbi:MAG: GNAT family N-acetyltransferase [Cyanobacteria bacterium SID2]|nr:GNAT family N-acetyltransferase [Cyanobacteria bacterium SID2]